MSRLSITLALLAWLGSVAVADPKAKAVIREHLVAVASEQGEHASATATAVAPDGRSVAPAEVFSEMHRASLVRLNHTVGTVALVVDDKLGIGWFQAPVAASVREPVGNGDVGEERKSTLRTGGVIVTSKGAWTIEAVVYSRPLADKKLAKRDGVPLATGAPAITGEPKLAAAVAAWFPSGLFASANKATAKLLATGTGPAELATGAGALKLVKRWDAQKLVPTAIHARILVPGRVGFVTATVLLPKKAGSLGVELHLAAVVIADGESWRWSALHLFAPAE